MSTLISVLVLILILGVLIITHEWGHYMVARKRGVRVLEFAIGMGPVIYKRQKNLPDGTEGTKFSLRLLPIGGFCAMEGEDEDSTDPHAFGNASVFSRFLILVAGSVMNLLFGLLLCFIFVIPLNYSATSVVESVEPESSLAAYVQGGDEIKSINGHRILRYENVLMFLSLGQGNRYAMDIIRDGETIKYTDMSLEMRDFEDGNGLRYGFGFGYRENTFGDKVKLAFATAVDYCRLVWVSLSELIFGNAGVGDMMGPVGMGGMVNEVVTAEIDVFSRVWNILNFAILISLNLGIMNLLPLPALDGGRIIFLAVEGIRRKPVPAKYEGIVHGAGLLFFFALMIFVMYNDIVRLVTGGNA